MREQTSLGGGEPALRRGRGLSRSESDPELPGPAAQPGRRREHTSSTLVATTTRWCVTGTPWSRASRRPSWRRRRDTMSGPISSSMTPSGRRPGLRLIRRQPPATPAERRRKDPEPAAAETGEENGRRAKISSVHKAIPDLDLPARRIAATAGPAVPRGPIPAGRSARSTSRSPFGPTRRSM